MATIVEHIRNTMVGDIESGGQTDKDDGTWGCAQYN